MLLGRHGIGEFWLELRVQVLADLGMDAVCTNKTGGSSGGAIVQHLGDISVGLRQKTDKLLVIVDGDVGLGDHGGELADEDMSVDAYAAVCVLFLAAKFVLVKRLVLP